MYYKGQAEQNTVKPFCQERCDEFENNLKKLSLADFLLLLENIKFMIRHGAQ